MTFIIVCLVCCALILAVIFFAKRHMQKVRQTCYVPPEKELVSMSDLEHVAQSDKARRRYDAELQRTKRIAICSIAVIFVVGAAAAVFDSYKKELLDGWSLTSTRQNLEKVEQAENLENELSFGNWLTAQFSYEKALEYYGAKRIAEVRDAEAEYKKCEEALKQAQKESDSVKMLSCRTRLNEAEAGLSEARADLATYDKFMHDWKLYLKLNWLILILLLVGGADLYFTLKGDKAENIWSDCCTVLSIIVAFVGVFWPFILWLGGYQCENIFTFKDVIGIILTVWCFVFFVEHASELD